MDLDSEVIDVDDSDVEFIGEEVGPSASSGGNNTTKDNIKLTTAATDNIKINNQQNTNKSQQQSQSNIEAMDTEDILPKNNLT